LADEGQQALIVMWDHASWHGSRAVRTWLKAHHQRVKHAGGCRLVLCHWPRQSPWLNPIAPTWVHGKRAIAEPTRTLTGAETRQRICADDHGERLAPLAQKVARLCTRLSKSWKGVCSAWAMGQSKAHQWIHVLLVVLQATLRTLGDAPSRAVIEADVSARVGSGQELPSASDVPSAGPAQPSASPLLHMLGPNDASGVLKIRLSRRAVIAARKCATRSTMCC
jgi:hypothetical protein